MAAGLEVCSGELNAFKKAFNHAASVALRDIDLAPVLCIDAVLSAEDVNWAFYDALRHLRPFGQENPEPVWALMGVCVAGAPRVVGKQHLKLYLNAGDRQLDAIAFNYPLKSLPAGLIDVAFTLKKNSWNGDDALQLQVVDIRPSQR